MVVENRGGAGGLLGAEVVTRAQADGYTVLIALYRWCSFHSRPISWWPGHALRGKTLRYPPTACRPRHRLGRHAIGPVCREDAP
ncbi:hypothetical protein DCO45_09680 [Comamonas sp. JNW]|nr:hypothetical protein DCO45_09680 [Comamonas sp. JNW]